MSLLHHGSIALGVAMFACAGAPVQESKPVVPQRSSAPLPGPKSVPQEKEEEPPGPRAVADSFSVPIPSGFEQYRDEAHQMFYSDGGVILAQTQPPAHKNGVQASILIAPLPNKGLDLSDAMLCFALSEDAAKSLSGDVAGVRKIDRAAGPTCQVLVKPSKEHKMARAEVVGGVDQIWMVTCNYDARDKSAQESCDQVVDGFRTRRAPMASKL